MSVNRYFNVFGLQGWRLDCQPQGLNIWGVITILLPAYIRAAGNGDSELQWQYENDRYVNMAGYTDTFNDGLDSTA